MESGYCFGFGTAVVGEATVAVIVCDSGLAPAETVIGDDINDDDDYDALGICCIFYGEYLQSLFK